MLCRLTERKKKLRSAAIENLSMKLLIAGVVTLRLHLAQRPNFGPVSGSPRGIANTLAFFPLGRKEHIRGTELEHLLNFSLPPPSRSPLIRAGMEGSTP